MRGTLYGNSLYSMMTIFYNAFSEDYVNDSGKQIKRLFQAYNGKSEDYVHNVGLMLQGKG